MASERGSLARVRLPGLDTVPQVIQDLPGLPAHPPPQQRTPCSCPRLQRQGRMYPDNAGPARAGMDRPPVHRPHYERGQPLSRLVLERPARRVEHCQPLADHARTDRILFDGVLDPVDGALRPDRSRPGIGVELKRADARRFAA